MSSGKCNSCNTIQQLDVNGLCTGCVRCNNCGINVRISGKSVRNHHKPRYNCTICFDCSKYCSFCSISKQIIKDGRCSECQNVCGHCNNKDVKIAFDNGSSKLCEDCYTRCCTRCNVSSVLLHKLKIGSVLHQYCGLCMSLLNHTYTEYNENIPNDLKYNIHGYMIIHHEVKTHLINIYSMMNTTFTPIIERLNGFDEQISSITKRIDALDKQLSCDPYKSTTLSPPELESDNKIHFCGYCGTKRDDAKHIYCCNCGSKY